jgi:hypothetical protein
MILITDIEQYMLPCLNKKLFGVECMGCGLQRSISLIFQGEFIAAFKMYPAIYTLIVLVITISINAFRPFKLGYKIIVTLAILNAIIMLSNFIFKTFLIN